MGGGGAAGGTIGGCGFVTGGVEASMGGATICVGVWGCTWPGYAPN